jgi:hypothetical protein
MLAKHKIKSVALPPKKIFSYLPPVKDVSGLKTLEYTTSLVNTAGFILDKAVEPFKSESKSTADI